MSLVGGVLGLDYATPDRVQHAVSWGAGGDDCAIPPTAAEERASPKRIEDWANAIPPPLASTADELETDKLTAVNS